LVIKNVYIIFVFVKEIDMRRKLTYEKCKEEVSKYDSYSEFIQTDRSVIETIRKNEWFDLLSHWEMPYSTTNPKWTYEKCKEEVSKLTYLKDLKGTALSNTLYKNGWYDELASHLIRKKKENITDDEIRTESLKYSTRTEFHDHSVSHYNAAIRKGIIDEVCLHMGEKVKPKKQYTKEEVLESALKYENQRDWKLNEPSVFHSFSNFRSSFASDEDKEFWSSCVEHMEYLSKPKGYWTYEKCEEITKNYSVLMDFENDYKSLAGIIRRNKWNNLLDHMKRQISNQKRFIYVCEFNTITPKFAYVGLTCQLEQRKNSHFYNSKGKSPVFEKINEVKIFPEFKILTPIPLKEEESIISEAMWMEEYRNMGYTLLNKSVAGSLGGGSKPRYPYRYFLKIKEGCKNREEFIEKISVYAKKVAIKNGWWEELTSDMVKTTIIHNEWTIELVKEKLLECKTKSELQKKYSGAVHWLKKNGIINEFFSPPSPRITWSYELMKERAAECRNRKEFGKKYPGGYDKALKLGYLDEFFPK
jgi:hypothetical protein